MCAAPHSCYTFRSVDDERVEADQKSGDFVLFYARYVGAPRLDGADETTVNLDKTNVVLVVFFDR